MAEKILVINAGSSSIKFTLFNNAENPIYSGALINHSGQEYFFRTTNSDLQHQITSQQFRNAADFILNKLITEGSVSDIAEIKKTIHRIVHGGEQFKKPVELTLNIFRELEKYNDYAPLHNPFALNIAKQFIEKLWEIKHYGVFDTSFHLTNKKENFLYGLPYGYYENIKIRRFGFHGINYSYVSKFNKDYAKKKLIICHLGSGSSVCAIQDGKSINHSFGFSPEVNLIMATRSGEIDYSAVIYLKNKLGLNDSDVIELLNKESGLLGISGYSKDMKVLLKDYETNDRAKLAVDMYIAKVVEYIAKFFVELQGCDYLIFTGGIGAGSDFIREKICSKVAILGIKIDKDKNSGEIDVSKFIDLSAEKSKTKVHVVPAGEEIEMVRQVEHQISENRG
ncbi:MAG: acetate kinase [Candidatus Dojkabacteria bacterium]